MDPPDILLSCWTMEAARSAVLSGRGHGDAGTRSAARARVLASRCASEGIGIVPRYASGHAECVAEVAGSKEETGMLGWFLLQRLGAFVDAHSGELLTSEQRSRMQDLAGADAADVDAEVAGGLPPAPPPEWPEAPEASAGEGLRARFGLLGDPHFGTKAADTLLPAVIANINRDQVAYTIALGDLTQNGRPENFRKAKLVFDTLDAPYECTLGNHDMWDGGRGRASFEDTFQRKPYGMLQTGGVRLIYLNTADPRPSPFPPFDLVTGAFTGADAESVPGGRLDPEAIEWMQQVKADGPTFIALHHPPYPYLGIPPIVFGLDASSTQHLESLIRRTQASALFCGHTHRCAIYEFAGAPVIEVPSAKEWPFGYGILEVTDEGWAYNLRPITDSSAVDEASASAGLLFRRYARGPAESRSLAARF